MTKQGDRLRAAKQGVDAQRDLLSPDEQGNLSFGVAVVHFFTVVACLFVLVAPCTAGWGVPWGLVGPLLGLGLGAAVGIPACIHVSRRLRARLYERALRSLEKPKLEDGTGGASTSTAVKP